MSSGGSGTPTRINPYDPYTADTSQLSTFIGTQAGAQFASLYKPNSSYATRGGNIFATTDAPGFNKKQVGPTLFEIPSQNYNDVTGMMKAYEGWLSGNQQTQANWSNYATLVNANAGGQGDSTITTGDAVGQRQALLGSLSNAGRPIGLGGKS